MAVGKEIRTKISSIQSTQKITSAMEMVAASKMRRAQDRMELGKPYAQRMQAVVGHIANSTPEYHTPTCKSERSNAQGISLFLLIAVCVAASTSIYSRQRFSR